MPSTCYLILGSPRSGTTLVASMVHALGVPLGETFTEGITDWAPGHFFADESLTYALMSLWKGEFKPAESVHPDELAGLEELIARREAAYPKWGIKVFGLPFCLPVLLPRLSDPRAIRCTRKRETSIASWRARRINDRPEPDEAEMVIDSHLAAIDNALAGRSLPTLILDFDDVVQGPPKRTTDALAAFLGVPSRREVDSLIDPSWRRF